MNEVINIKDVEAKVLTIRQQAVLLAQDVAELYGVETREVSQAIKNNPLKFPDGYVFELTGEEVGSLKSKFLTLGEGAGRGHYSKRGYKAFTEKGLYMLATILKGERAVLTTRAIIETFAKVRSMVRDMERLQTMRRTRLMTAASKAISDSLRPRFIHSSRPTTGRPIGRRSSSWHTRHGFEFSVHRCARHTCGIGAP